jgi:hypothetical protein
MGFAEESSEMGVCLLGPIEEPGGFHLLGILKDSRRALEGEHLSLRELC